MMKRYSFGHLRITGQEMAEANEAKIDLVAERQREIREAFEQEGLTGIEFHPAKAPGYVIGPEHPSAKNFRIYVCGKTKD
ncbi:hypothetical protein [Cytobacillus oceanisediminis]|uniref:hypothetical protein n=1 Tax=Cytobacillus oceanisediminis TaxID=665099 RepID=UPI001FB35495|nr:hypothetical protein [Cytobacillus oceanisediminis]UOE58099.1 hypothetical protein IRB79_26680 [Cytobacillus oceanisediminis]